MPNDTENSHSSDQHRISWIQAVFFLLATVVDDFPLNSDLSSKQKNVSYLQGAHYSGPNIFKTLFKASVQLAVQHSSGTRDFFLLKVKPVCAGNTTCLGAGLSMWNELPQEWRTITNLPIWVRVYAFDLSLTNAKHTFKKKKKKQNTKNMLGYTAHTILPWGKDERKNILWQQLIVFVHVLLKGVWILKEQGGGSAVRTNTEENSLTNTHVPTRSIGLLPCHNALLSALAGTHFLCHLHKLIS